jgi:threonine dehydrogenase-like Zn-dependent dehydrogenase
LSCPSGRSLLERSSAGCGCVWAPELAPELRLAAAPATAARLGGLRAGSSRLDWRRRVAGILNGFSELRGVGRGGLHLHTGGKERMRRLMSVIQSGRTDLSRMVTHRFKLRDIEAAYDLFGNQRDGVLKVAITP